MEGTKTGMQNEELMEQVDEDEVRMALFQMNPNKAPGPDGMTPIFLKKNCKVVGRIL